MLCPARFLEWTHIILKSGVCGLIFTNALSLTPQNICKSKSGPKYNARIEECIHLIQPPHNYHPELSIIRSPRPEGSLADNPYLVEMLESEFREPYIEIVYLPTGELEVYLSPLDTRLPLRASDADAVLDLPAVLNRTYYMLNLICTMSPSWTT
ncbi:MAG: hypothetical protein Fur0021_38630 [Candidatus Promineifilaceae bacterium]